MVRGVKVIGVNLTCDLILYQVKPHTGLCGATGGSNYTIFFLSIEACGYTVIPRRQAIILEAGYNSLLFLTWV